MKTILFFLIMSIFSTTVFAQAKPCKNATSQPTVKVMKCGNKADVSSKDQAKTEVLRISTCRMHPDVVLDKDGNCYQCIKSMSAKIYTCRIHPDVVLDKDGNCYECAKAVSAKGF
ncbi:MAG TPA: hypothetical protein VJ499_07880 [Flavisolibacter sp.]|nr:hypothetical protein [Flavisolibacter sp.]